ncbi:MAG: preprotein translocase subunit SecE [Lentisphaerae bacterium]|nr:preprotein translocase subunit SecE [Lentisphaerota bacterium]
MSKLKDTVAAFVGFVTDVVAETKKASWPTRQELLSSTVVVIVSLSLLGLFVGLSDRILIFLLSLLTGTRGS